MASSGKPATKAFQHGHGFKLAAFKAARLIHEDVAEPVFCLSFARHFCSFRCPSMMSAGGRLMKERKNHHTPVMVMVGSEDRSGPFLRTWSAEVGRPFQALTDAWSS